MITLEQTAKLGAVHAVRPSVLSLYLAVPLVPAELRGLQARADDLISAAERAAGGGWHVADADRDRIREELELSGRDWLGRTVAVFASADSGLFEALALPGGVPERAVLGVRPHIRPLLAAVRRWPSYRVAVVDRRHAWLYHVTGEETETVTAPVSAGVRDRRFGGWYGLQSYRVQQRVARLARHHYRDTAAMLEGAMADGAPEPLVIGGHDDGIHQLLASLSPAARERFAGSFAADERTLTPARVRELAEPLVARWAGQHADRLAGQVLTMPPGGLAASGLRATLAAVNARAVQILVVPDEGLVPGFECEGCGALSVDSGRCPHCGAAVAPVPDVIEEMVARVLQDGGQVYPGHDSLSRIAARLRFPVPGQ